ncbi:uncharacterized protein LOC134772112 [Penaeus indicus]|uniref:uncharacterized protein LOC134772112 n=1 Tax=Penaeus indicus TaxID=29960 RepID=UPI00300CE7B9
MNTEDGHKLWYSGDEKKHIRGVGVLVEKETAKSVIEFTPVSDRIITIRPKRKPRNMTVIQIYAPTSNSDDEEIEQFYQDLEQTINDKAKKDILVIMYWNAKIGYKESTGWEGTIGDFGVGKTNDIVMMTFRMRLSKEKKVSHRRAKFDLEKLKNRELAEKYRTNEILGKAKPIKRPWVTPEILQKCEETRERKKNRFTNNENLDQYRKLNKEVERAIIKAKDEWVEKQAEDIEQSLAVNNSRKAYNVIKSLTREKSGRTNAIEDKTGQLLTNNTEVTARWKEYCRELYQHQADVDRTLLAEATSEGEIEQDILESEVRAAIIKLKMNKAPGFDNLPAELIKCGGDPTVKTLHLLCNRILQTSKWPTQWTQSILIPIPKKKMSKKCSEHRTVSLISHPSKVLLTIILNRIKPGIEEILDESQAGFRKDRSTVKQISNLRLLCESQRNHQKNVFHNFIDFKKKHSIEYGTKRYGIQWPRGIKCTGRVVNNLIFADDINLIAENAEELAEITKQLDETLHSGAYIPEIYLALLGMIIFIFAHINIFSKQMWIN